MTIPHDPIFKTVGQALYIVYAMEVTPVGNKGATQVAIENMMEDRYGDCRDEREQQINMGSMTAYELRAQCGVVRRWVEELLANAERDLVWARYGQRRINDFGQIVLDRRAMGVEGLTRNFGGLCTTGDDRVVKALVMGIFASGAGRRRSEWSLRKVERELGISKSALHRDQLVLRSACTNLEIRAISRLEEHFTRKGLIADPAAYA